MLTFTVNPTLQTVQGAALTVLPNKRVVHFDKYEQVGVSEGFVKKVENKLTESKFNAGAFGFTIERNIKMTNADREVSLLSGEDIENRAKGVSDSCNYEDSFAGSDILMESWELSIGIVKEVFGLIEDHIIDQESKGMRSGPILSSTIRTALTGNARCISTLVRLKNDYNDFSYLFVPASNKVMIDFLDDIGTLGGLLEYILNHRALGEALGLYENQNQRVTA